MNPSTETSGKPKYVDDATFEAASLIVHRELGGHSAAHKTAHGLTVIIARAMMAAKAEEREGCLSDLQAILDDLPSHDPGVCLDMATRAIRKRGEG